MHTISFNQSQGLSVGVELRCDRPLSHFPETPPDCTVLSHPIDSVIILSLTRERIFSIVYGRKSNPLSLSFHFFTQLRDESSPFSGMKQQRNEILDCEFQQARTATRNQMVRDVVV